MKQVELATWTARSFRSTRLEKLGAVVCDLTFNQDGHLVGTLTNRTSWRIEAPTLLLGGRRLELRQTLEAGETRAIDQGLSRATETPQLAKELLAGLGRYVDRYGSPTALAARDPFGGDPARRLEAALGRRLAAVAVGPASVPVLFAGFVQKDLGGVTLDLKARLEMARALVLSEVAAAVPSDAPFRFQEMPPRVLKGVGYSAADGTPGSPVRLSPPDVQPGQDLVKGSVIYEWRLPAAPGQVVEVQKLSIRWRLLEEIETANDNAPQLDFWDWEQGQFFTVERIASRESSHVVLAQRLGAYVQGGLVRVRLSSRRELHVEAFTLGEAAGRRYTRGR